MGQVLPWAGTPELAGTTESARFANRRSGIEALYVNVAKRGSTPTAYDAAVPAYYGTGAGAGTDMSGTDASSATDLLATFIKQSQASQSQVSACTAGGSSKSSRTATALLLNFEA